jgi:type IV pilus assembly protein PilM
MAAGSESVWAVDLGNASLKAIHLMAVGDAVQVIGFDHIPHGKILSGGGISATERDELIAITLRQFVQRNDVSEDTLIVSVPSQNSFVRFVTLPPVEQKRIPEIIRFEAAQQIPFDLAEVQWDSQLLSEPDSKEQKVGIFAIKNDIVKAAMEHFEREDLQVGYVQIAPMALYNFLLYDRPELARSDTQATVIVNVGADCTDLVACTKSSVWQRCIMTGGNAFTQAIAETFKLSFEKAEKLKRTAPVSKYARQIFQAMRPVFTDWAAEVQRSLGFYTSSNTEVKLTRVVAMGGGTKLRGLTKYLQQSLEIPVEKPEAFKRLSIAEGLSAAKFQDSVADFGVAYGLALQGVGMARIESNLLPGSVVRSMAWANKTRYFIGAAVMIFAFSLLRFGRVGLDWIGYAQASPTQSLIQSDIKRAENVSASEKGLVNDKNLSEDKEKKQVEFFKYREVVPELYAIIRSALPNAKNNPAQAALYDAYARGRIAEVEQIPRIQRKQLFITGISIYYSNDLATAQFGESTSMRKEALAQQAQMLDQQLTGGGGGANDPYGNRGISSGRDLPTQTATTTTQAVETDRGFVVTLYGYSPYGKKIMDLLEPSGVGNDQAKWGFITRLANLDKLSDVNSPFQLYSRDSAHLKIDRGVVDMSDKVPQGIGVYEKAAVVGGPAAARPAVAGATTPTDNQVLVDEMTRELISADVDVANKETRDVYGSIVYKKERDYWFIMNFKMKWREAPAPPAAVAATPGR